LAARPDADEHEYVLLADRDELVRVDPHALEQREERVEEATHAFVPVIRPGKRGGREADPLDPRLEEREDGLDAAVVERCVAPAGELDVELGRRAFRHGAQYSR